MIKETIEKHLKTAWAGKTCLCFDTLGSTNDYAKELLQKHSAHGWLVTADLQTAGKGRRGRRWESAPGENISMSLCLEPEVRAEHTAGLTLAAALAAAEGVSECAGVQPLIKWPNDLVLGGRKICGILTEMCMRAEGCAIVIGVGINVNAAEFPPEISGTATSLFLETGRRIDREELAAAVWNHFERLYDLYQETEDLSQLKEQYEARLANKDRTVRVLDAKAPYTGIARGISADGGLLVECGDKTMREVRSGEVSVRGVYGYL